MSLLRWLSISVLGLSASFALAASDWQPTVLPGYVSKLVQHRGALYTAGNGGQYADEELLYKSTDGGVTWQGKAFIPKITSSQLLLSLNGALYASGYFYEQGYTTTHLYKSLDDGVSWQKIDDALPSFVGLTAMGDVLYVESVDTIFKSLDGGNNWVPTPLALPLSFLSGSGNLLYSFVDNSGIRTPLFSFGNYDFVKSTDGGATWTTLIPADWLPRSTYLVDGLNIYVAYSLPSNTSVADHVYKSSDGGVHWTTCFASQDDGQWHNLGGIWAYQNKVYVNDGVLQVSSDDCKSWTPIGKPDSANPQLIDGKIYFVEGGKLYVSEGEGDARLLGWGLPPVNTNGLYGLNGQVMAVTQGSSLLTFSEAEDRWVKGGSLPSSFISSMISDDKAVYVTNENALQRSTDGLKTWKKISINGSFGTDYCPPAFQVSSTILGNALYAAYPHCGLFRSNDQGNTWVQIDASLPINSGVFSSGNTLYLYKNSSLMRSQDGGANWATLTEKLPSGSYVVIAEKLFSYGNAGLSYSADGGKSWATTLSSYSITRLVEANGKLYAAGNRYQNSTYVGGVFRSDDGGANWEEEDLGAKGSPVSALFATPNALYAQTTKGILRKSLVNARGGIYLCNMALNGKALDPHYLVISSNAAGKAVISNPALSATPAFYGKVNGSISGSTFTGANDAGTPWKATFTSNAFNFTSSDGSAAYTGACSLIFDAKAPATSPAGGSYNCTLSNGATTELVLTLNGASQMVVTNPAKTPLATYYGYVVGTLSGSNFQGMTDTGRAWNGSFSGQTFNFTSVESVGSLTGSCQPAQ